MKIKCKLAASNYLYLNEENNFVNLTIIGNSSSIFYIIFVSSRL